MLYSALARRPVIDGGKTVATRALMLAWLYRRRPRGREGAGDLLDAACEEVSAAGTATRARESGER